MGTGHVYGNWVEHTVSCFDSAMLIFAQHVLFSVLQCVRKGLVSITQGKGTPWSGFISRGETMLDLG